MSRLTSWWMAKCCEPTASCLKFCRLPCRSWPEEHEAGPPSHSLCRLMVCELGSLCHRNVCSVACRSSYRSSQERSPATTVCPQHCSAGWCPPASAEGSLLRPTSHIHIYLEPCESVRPVRLVLLHSPA